MEFDASIAFQPFSRARGSGDDGSLFYSCLDREYVNNLLHALELMKSLTNTRILIEANLNL